MNVLSLIFLVICPFIAMIILLIVVNRFDIVLNNREEIREKQISFRKIKDFFPKNLRRVLESDSSIENRYIDEVLDAYRKILFAIGLYYIFWIIYFAFIVIRIFWLFNGHYELLEPQKFGYVIGSDLMGILILYWFCLTPIFEFFQRNKLANLGYAIWDFIQNGLKRFYECCWKIGKRIIQFTITLSILVAYIYLMNLIFVSLRAKITFLIALLILMIYQYMVLKIISSILQNFIIFLIKKCYKLYCLEKYTRDEIMYLELKNYAYLSMVLIFAVATDANKSDLPMVAAMGVLFLIDTFISQEKAIQEKLEKSNSQE